VSVAAHLGRTGGMTGRASGQDSRTQIMRVAADLFMQLGYAATSLDAVAARLGSTKGRIYHHYRSKADLFIDVQATAMVRLLAEVEPIARAPGPAVGRLAAMALRHTQILLTELPMQKVAVQGLERHLAGAARQRLRSVVRMRDDYEQIFAEVIEQGIREGDLHELPPRLATKPFFGVMNWATLWYSQRRLQDIQAINDLATTLAACAMRGLTKDKHHESARFRTPFAAHLG